MTTSIRVVSAGMLEFDVDGETLEVSFEAIVAAGDLLRTVYDPPKKSYGLESLSEMRPKEPCSDG
jgi:hypothetical protein